MPKEKEQFPGSQPQGVANDIDSSKPYLPPSSPVEPYTKSFHDIFKDIKRVDSSNPVLTEHIPSSVQSAAVSFRNLSNAVNNPAISPPDKKIIIETYKNLLSKEIAGLPFPEAIPHILQFITTLYNTVFGYNLLQELAIEDFFDFTNPQIIIGMMLTNAKKGFPDKGRRFIWDKLLSQFSQDDIERQLKKLFDNIDELDIEKEECKHLKEAIARELVSYALEQEGVSVEEVAEAEEIVENFPQLAQAVFNALDYSDVDLKNEILNELYRNLQRWKTWFKAGVKSTTYLEELVHGYLKKIQITPNDIRQHSIARLNKTVQAEELLALPQAETGESTTEEPEMEEQTPSSEEEIIDHDSDNEEDVVDDQNIDDEDI